MMRVKGQISMISIIIILSLIIFMTVLVMEFQNEIYRVEPIETKSMAISEILDNIRFDLKRVLSLIISNASRTYAFHPYLHNLTIFRENAIKYLHEWMLFISKKYDAIIQIRTPGASITIDNNEFEIPSGSIFKLYWYKLNSITLGFIEVSISIPKAGIYNKIINASISLYLSIVNVENEDNVTSIKFRVLIDNGVPLTDIRDINITILYPDFNYYWRRARIIGFKYLRNGLWEVNITPKVNLMGVTSSGNGVIPLRIYVMDWRGIVVSALTYTGIILRVDKNTPDRLYYYQGAYKVLERNDTPDEMYTIELDWNFNLHFLLNEIKLEIEEESEKPPPIPPIPVKQLRVYVSSNLEDWILCPFQCEYWRKISWHGHEIWIPISPANPAYWFNESCRLVFQVSFNNVSDKFRYIMITWMDDCDSDLIEWNTTLKFDYRLPDYKDVISDTFRVELIDIEHRVMRDYNYDYHGVAALGFREPNGSAFGPTNIHAFGTYISDEIRYLGRYRPYGKWEVFSKYIGEYSWASLPVRILIKLDTDKVGNVYAEGDIRDDYYDTIAITYIINGSKYMACLIHIYWKTSRSDYGSWMFASMGGGKPEYYMYLKLNENGIENVTRVYSYEDLYSHNEYDYPNYFCTHWGNGIGRAVFLSKTAVQALYNIGNPKFAVTKWAPGNMKQHSLEYQFNSLDDETTFNAGTYYSYWFVIYMYEAEDNYDEWLEAYKYLPMFIENYAPSIKLVKVN